MPYLQIKFPRSAVVEVVIGPGREREVRERGVRILLDAAGFDPDAGVRLSEAPFRG